MQAHSHFDTLHDISPGKHFYQFYKTADDLLQMVVPYIQAGLEKGDACLLLISDRVGLEFTRDKLSVAIDYLPQALASHQLVIKRAEDWYLSNGAFDEFQATQSISAHLRTTQSMGFRRLRVAGDIGGAVPGSGWEQCNHYEGEISPWVQTQGVIALCAYPILDCTPTQTKRVLDCHDDVLMGHL